MKKVILFFFLFPIVLKAQEKLGIKFEQKLSWKEIKSKAKAENKFIFVDCFATWCQPCREMDEKVYLNETLGIFMAREFISVKYQLDTTKLDDENTIMKYIDAASIMETYEPQAFPTLLFFSPEGELVDRYTGAEDAVGFAIIASNAINPNRQFFSKIKKFNTGDLTYEDMPALAKAAKTKDLVVLGKQVAQRYIDGYILKLTDKALFTKDNIEFISNYYSLLNSTSPSFDLFYNHGSKVDSVMNIPGWAASYISYVINKEEIFPKVQEAKKAGKEPDWTTINSNIKLKYKDRFEDNDLSQAKSSWYKYRKDWKNYTKYLILQTNAQKPNEMKMNANTAMILNNNAMQIYYYSDSKKEMEIAIGWVDKLLSLSPKPSPGAMDTKAGLLYKLGKVSEAISLETKADSVYRTQEKNAKEGFRPVIEKMKKGEKTWLQ